MWRQERFSTRGKFITNQPRKILRWSLSCSCSTLRNTSWGRPVLAKYFGKTTLMRISERRLIDLQSLTGHDGTSRIPSIDMFSRETVSPSIRPNASRKVGRRVFQDILPDNSMVVIRENKGRISPMRSSFVSGSSNCWSCSVEAIQDPDVGRETRRPFEQCRQFPNFPVIDCATRDEVV